MKKIREEKDDLMTTEIYEVTLDEIAEGLPEVLREVVSRRWRKEVDEWVEKFIVDKAKDEPIFRLELHCKNGAVIPSSVMQGDITPRALTNAFDECYQRLGYCVQFYYCQVSHDRKTKSNVIPFGKR